MQIKSLQIRSTQCVNIGVLLFFHRIATYDLSPDNLTAKCGSQPSATYFQPSTAPCLSLLVALLCRSLPRRLERTPRVPATQLELSVQSLGKVPGTAIFVTARPFKIVC
ncbi:hypothetical protein PMIN06_012530 [Paraphaeosphaeria minitans]